jgi:hypothetical protein
MKDKNLAALAGKTRQGCPDACCAYTRYSEFVYWDFYSSLLLFIVFAQRNHNIVFMNHGIRQHGKFKFFAV